MQIEWSQDLSVGVEEIDDQHKAMITHVNTFFTSLDNGKGKEELIRFFRFLVGYAQAHFSLEADYMTKFHRTGHSYGDELVHKAEHEAFIRDFLAFQEELESGTVTQQLVMEFRDWIRNWLQIHLCKMDKGLGAYLNEVFPFIRPARSRG